MNIEVSKKDIVKNVTFTIELKGAEEVDNFKTIISAAKYAMHSKMMERDETGDKLYKMADTLLATVERE